MGPNLPLRTPFASWDYLGASEYQIAAPDISPQCGGLIRDPIGAKVLGADRAMASRPSGPQLVRDLRPCPIRKVAVKLEARIGVARCIAWPSWAEGPVAH